MNVETASAALKSGKCLQLTYDGITRLVEIHAIGTSTAGNLVMRVFQVSGGSNSGKDIGWKLMKLDESLNPIISNEPSLAPRQGYKRDDSQIPKIIIQI